MKKDIFLSHAWANDNLDRNNHLRCKILADKLINEGYEVWFDEYNMVGNIDNCIVKNINNCSIVLLCLTETYSNKINNGIFEGKINDNCFKEWNYSLFKNKTIIPVIMEPKMFELFNLNNTNSQNLLQLYLKSLLYMNITTDNYATNDYKLLCKTLKEYEIYTKNEKNDIANGNTSRNTTRNTSRNTTINTSENVSGNQNENTSGNQNKKRNINNVKIKNKKIKVKFKSKTLSRNSFDKNHRLAIKI